MSAHDNERKGVLLALDVLEALGLYMEHPDATATWTHLTTRAPHSGRRAFYP